MPLSLSVVSLAAWGFGIAQHHLHVAKCLLLGATAQSRLLVWILCAMGTHADSSGILCRVGKAFQQLL